MSDERPLAIDMFCGISGWGAGLIAAGYRVIGFDIENMFKVTGEPMPEHFSLVIQDVLTIHGSQFKDAALIVSSSPCQAYSWMAMPWSLAKAKRAAILADETGEAKRKLNELFDAQFRIQREACEAAGRHIPMIVENVRGSQEWVGQARGNYGSYYLWGDVPMIPTPVNARKVPGFRFDGVSKKCFQQAAVEMYAGISPDEGRKTKGMNWSDRSLKGQDFTRIGGMQAIEGRKNGGGSWFNIGSPGQKIVGQNPVHALTREGVKGSEGYDRDHPAAFGWKKPGTSSGSKARKAASAKIAKIPFALSKHIGEVFHPRASERYAMARVRQSCLFGDDA